MSELETSRSSQLWNSFWEIQKNIVRCIQKSAATYELSVPQYMILMTMMHHGEIPQKCVREITRLPKSTLSQAIDKLVQDRILERKPLTNNRREMGLIISETGRDLISEIKEQKDGVHQLFKNALEDIDEEKFQMLIQTHEAIALHFRDKGRDDRC